MLTPQTSALQARRKRLTLSRPSNQLRYHFISQMWSVHSVIEEKDLYLYTSLSYSFSCGSCELTLRILGKLSGATTGHARAQYQLALCMHHGRWIETNVSQF